MDYLPEDVHMLVSLLNMKLRDQYSDLTDLCQAMNLDRTALVAKLSAACYHYDEHFKQFKCSDDY